MRKRGGWEREIKYLLITMAVCQKGTMPVNAGDQMKQMHAYKMDSKSSINSWKLLTSVTCSQLPTKSNLIKVIFEKVNFQVMFKCVLRLNLL